MVISGSQTLIDPRQIKLEREQRLDSNHRPSLIYPERNKFTHPKYQMRVMTRLPPSIVKEAIDRQGEDGTQLRLTKGKLDDIRYYVMFFASEIVGLAGLAESTKKREYHLRGRYTVPEFRRSNIQNAIRNQTLEYQREQAYRIPYSYGKTYHKHITDQYKKQGSIIISGHEHPRNFKENDPNFEYLHIYTRIKDFKNFHTGDLKWKFDNDILKD